MEAHEGVHRSTDSVYLGVLQDLGVFTRLAAPALSIYLTLHLSLPIKFIPLQMQEPSPLGTPALDCLLLPVPPRHEASLQTRNPRCSVSPIWLPDEDGTPSRKKLQDPLPLLLVGEQPKQ